MIINEASSANLRVLLDMDEDAEDWIEIYNPGPDTLNLAGYGLSDEFEEPFKWVFPPRVFFPDTYLIVFASEKDRTGIELHANFKLKSSGETIRLVDVQGALLSELAMTPVTADVSMGWANGELRYFAQATPSAPNTSQAYLGITPEPEFEPERGLYSGGLMVEIEVEGEDDLGWSDDGSIPEGGNPDPHTTVPVNETVTLRARAFRPDYIPSRIVTHSYVIDEPVNLPVVCVTLDPVDLWDPVFGIYVQGDSTEPDWPYYGANFWEDWEKHAHWEFFEPQGGGFHLEGGAKIHGGWSRAQPQKALRMVARDAYGESEVDYPLYAENGFTEYKRLILRNCGNDFPYAHIRDILAHSLAAHEDLETMANRACMVFLNGEYWGYQNLRERHDKFYTKNHFGVEDVDLLEARRTAIEGDNEHWDAMVEFISANDISTIENYEYVKTQMDVVNFTVYNCYELFLANTDWPDHNIKRWRPREEGGRWRWLYFDLDLSLYAGSGHPDYNMIDMATNPDEGAYGNPYWSTVILNKLLKNTEFKHLFLNHYCDRLNSVFLPSNLHAVMDSVKATILPEVPRHRERWELWNSWSSRLNPIRDFIDERPDHTRANFMDYFFIPDSLTLSLDIDPPGAGRIALTAVVVDSAWSGVYFEGILMELKALPNDGWIFDSWSDGNMPQHDQATVTLYGDSSIVATFVQGTGGQAVINEINYKSSDFFDCGDWVEFHNPGQSDLDMSDWQFRDEEDTHIYWFPPGTTLPAGGYLVLVKDRSEFLECFPKILNLLPGEMGFGLGTEDMARLFNDLGEMVDLVLYSNLPPWPTEPDGQGPTLELIDPLSDNLHFGAWAASIAEYGTPGQINSVTEAVSAPETALPARLALAPPSPNPFNPSTSLRFDLPSPASVTLTVYDIEGRRVRRLVEGHREAGSHLVTWRGRDDGGRSVSSGIYLAALQAGDRRLSRKLILLK